MKIEVELKDPRLCTGCPCFLQSGLQVKCLLYRADLQWDDEFYPLRREECIYERGK